MSQAIEYRAGKIKHEGGSRMRSLILFFTVVIAVSAGCSADLSISLSKTEASKFHKRLVANDINTILNMEKKEFERIEKKKILVLFFKDISKKLGHFKKTTCKKWHVIKGPEGKKVSLVYFSEFENGTATESFSFKEIDGAAKLYKYNINSTAIAGLNNSIVVNFDTDGSKEILVSYHVHKPQHINYFQTLYSNSSSPIDITRQSKQNKERFLNKIVTISGIAYNARMGAIIDTPEGFIYSADFERWPEGYYGKKITATGILIKKYDLPVFIQKKGDPLRSGMPMPPGTNLKEASKRFLLKNIKYHKN